MQDAKIFLTWTSDGITKHDEFPLTENFTHGDLSLTPSMKKLEHGQLFTLELNPKSSIILNDLSIRFSHQDANYEKMMVNGYQSWTQSREMGRDDQIPSLRWFVHRFLAPYGDYAHYKTPHGKGHFHSWTYSHFRSPDSSILLLGSIDETFAYTIIDFDFTTYKMMVKKELHDLNIQDICTPFQLYIGKGEEIKLWEEYTSSIPVYRKPVEKCSGWTSWYNYYTGVTEDILLENLQILTEQRIPLDVFQIDDGFQRALGDWLEVNDKFPSGMNNIANKIKTAGFKPGLWLAPFICDKESLIYQQHPDWLLKDKKGKPLRAGWNPLWNGWFYALDFYAPGFQEYLREVFDTVLNVWGYEMVKLDFLYAVALLPRKDKSRGQIMNEVLSFIRELVGDRWILGCGVPLGPAFGQLDYCRIGSDVAPFWEDNKLTFVNYRERVSTLNSLMSSIGRWYLNRRVFLNDPDVFILRDKENKLSNDERYTLFILNNLLGDLIFFSDHIGEYNAEQLKWLRSMYPLLLPVIRNIEETNQVYHITFTINDREYHLYTNLGNQNYSFSLNRPVFINEEGYVSAGEELILKEHQSICLYFFTEIETKPVLVGSLGHIFPGSQVKTFEGNGEVVKISLHEDSSPETIIYIGSPLRITNLKINGKYYSVKLNNQGLRYVSLSKKDLE